MTLVSLGPYRELQWIATGASSSVYRAVHNQTGQLFALKVFNPHFVADPQMRQRLEREAQVLKQITHPNVVRCHELAEWDGQLTLVLEYVEGHNLSDWLKLSTSPFLEVRYAVLSQIAKALSCVHELDLIHRDLKPENILVSHSGQIKLADFGLSKSLVAQNTLTQDHSLIGSLSYMSPEVLNGQPSSMASDIYSFGLIGYELLCGSHPFRGLPPEQVIREITSQKIEPLKMKNPAVCEPVASIFDKCLDKSPSERPSGIWWVDATLQSALRSSPLRRYLHELIGPLPPSDLLRQALEAKQQHLMAGLENMQATTPRPPEFYSQLNEYVQLFPDDPRPSLWLNASSNQTQAPLQYNKPRKWWPLALATGIAALVLLATVQLGTQTSAPTPKLKPAPTPLPTSPPTTLIESPAPPPKPKAKPKTQKPSRGYLTVKTDSDVKVFVNGVSYSHSEVSKLALEPGHHRLRLEKQGFDPIENTISIKANNTTVVRAQRQEL